MRPKKSIYLLAVPALLLAITVLLSSRPYYNWDMFPYMAIAIADPSIAFETTHHDVYQTAQSSLPPGDYDAISQRQPELMKNPEEFQNILKYFQLKPGYNRMVSVFHGLGFNLVTATYLPSLVSYFLLGCILFWWALHTVPPFAAATGALVIMAAPLLTDLARYSSPDLLCATVSVAGLVLLLESFSLAGLSVLLLSVLIRPDSIILFFLVTGAMAMARRTSMTTCLIFGIIGIGWVLLIVNDFALIKEFALPFQPENNSSFTTDYFSGLAEGLSLVFHSYTLLFLGLTSGILVVRHLTGYTLLSDLLSLLTMAAGSALIFRYLLHPVVEDRFNLPSYLLIMMVVTLILAEKVSPSSIRT